MPSKLILRRLDAEEAVHHLLCHPVFAWLGLRPILGQHTNSENVALKKWASGRSRLVEIGVAEGASALALREVMSRDGTLWLIDPFHLSRRPRINAMKRAARRAVGSCRIGKVIWIERFSHDAVIDWDNRIDFLFVDGDHSELAVQRDWDEWSPFVVRGGIVAFHDARIFPGGWCQPDWGPVRLVDKLFRSPAPHGWQVVEEVDSLVVLERC